MGFKPSFGRQGHQQMNSDSENSGSNTSSYEEGSSEEDISEEDVDRVDHSEIKLDMNAYNKKEQRAPPAIPNAALPIAHNNYLKVPDNNDTGKMINLIFKMHKDTIMGKPKALYRGNIRILLYTNAYSITEPTLCLGPNWKRSILIFICLNIV